jgi:hypothetical protein
MGTGRLAEELALQSDLHVIVVEPDAERVDGWRRRLDQAGLYGHRIVVHVADPLQFPLPPYLAELIVCEEPPGVDSQAAALLEKAFAALRPYGGTFCLELSTPATKPSCGRAARRVCRMCGSNGSAISRSSPAPEHCPAPPITAASRTSIDASGRRWDCCGSATPCITTSSFIGPSLTRAVEDCRRPSK